jgi:uncharacterized membrane protein YdbT with pleckstrin-like domain
MGYVENNLMNDEVVVYKASLHWALFLSTVFWALLTIAAAVYSYVSGDKDFITVSFILLGFTLIAFFNAFIKKYTSEYIITNRRLILKRGLISRKSVELYLAKCEGISIDQGILGRILGYGTLITTTGGVTNKFRKIKDPIIFRNHINAQVDIAQRKQ